MANSKYGITNTRWLPKILKITTENIEIDILSSNILNSNSSRMYYKKHYHNFYELHYVLHGAIDMNIGNPQNVCISAGNFVIHPPFLEHQNVAFRENTEIFGFSFSLIRLSPKLRNFLDTLVEQGSKICEATEQMQKLVEVMRTLSIPTSELDTIIFENIIETFFLATLSVAIKENDNVRLNSKNEQSVENIKAYILLNSYRKLSLAEVAEEFHFSIRQLERKIKEFYGCTVGELINISRIDTIKGLLIGTDLNIVSVANMTGFDDVSAFSKFFKRHTGKKPTEFREESK